MSRRSTPPKYARHSSGQARVRIRGKVHYLGEHGTPESKARYRELISAYLNEPEQVQKPADFTIGELALKYLKHAERYYRKDGELTGHIFAVRASLRYLVRFFRNRQAESFSARDLNELREQMISDGHSRSYINQMVGIIKRSFRWAGKSGHLTRSVAHALEDIEGLQEGRSDARETDEVQSVPDGDVDAILPHVSQQVAAMIQLQRLTGMRPGEVIILRPCDITFHTKGPWAYRPCRHKMEHKKKERVVFIGPRGQEILRPWLDRDPDDYCFKPCESDRRTRRKNGPGERYRRDSYRTAVQRACKKAGVTPWTPNQLRHSHATRVREEFGLEAAQVVLGHAKADVTQIYAERNAERAAEVQRQIG